MWTFTGGEWKPALVILRINRAATMVKWSPQGKWVRGGSESRDENGVSILQRTSLLWAVEPASSPSATLRKRTIGERPLPPPLPPSSLLLVCSSPNCVYPARGVCLLLK